MKFLKIGPGEGKKVLIFFILAALIQAGVVLGVSVADGLFLTKLGVEKLPQVFIAMPMVMIIAVPIFDYVLNSLGINKVLSFTLLLLFLGGMAFAGWLQLVKDDGDTSLVVYSLKLYSYLWFIITYTLYWNFVGEYFYLLDAKRLYPILSGGLTFGGVFGGGLVGYYGKLFPPSFFLSIWSVLVVFALLIFLFIIKNYRKTTEDDFNESKYSLKSFGGNLKFIVSSRFAILINLVFFSGIILATLAEYQYSSVFSKNKSEEELISFFGLMFSLASGLNFFINFFIFSRLVHWVGVRNMALIYPCVIAVVFGVFALYESTHTAFLLFFAIQSILISVDLNNWNFIYRAFRTSLQKTIRLFTEGIVDPFATCLAGAFLIVSNVMDFNSTKVSMVALGISSLHIFFAFALKNNYLGAVVEALKEEGFELFQSLSSMVKEKGLTKGDVSLVKKAILDIDEKVIIFYFNILWSHNPKLAVETILQRFENKSIENDRIFKFLFELVFAKEKDYDLIRVIVHWVKQNYDRAPLCLINQLVLYNYLNYQEIPFRNQEMINSLQMSYLISRWNSSPEVEDSLEVLDELNKMLGSNKKEDTLSAIEILGHIGESKYLDLLEDYLDHPSTAIREQAISSVEKLVNVTSDKILPKLVQRLPYEERRTQLSLLNSVSYIKDSGASNQLLQISDLLSPRERRQVFETVCEFGLRAVPVVISTLNDKGSSLVAKSLASRVLARLAFPQFESLAPKIIDFQINRAYELLHMRSVLKSHEKGNPNVSLLARFYRDIQQEEVDYILEILTLSGQMPDFELLKSSLRSENLQIKGNAIEALEQGIPRSVFRKLLPLIDSSRIKDKVDFYLEKIASKNESKEKRRINFDQIIQITLKGSYFTGISIALQIVWEYEKNHFNQEVEKMLHDIDRRGISEQDNKKVAFLIEVVNSLFKRKNEGKNGFNLVERLAVMIQNNFWKDVKIETLLPIAQSAVEVNVNQIESEKQKDDFFYMVIFGKISVKIGDVTQEIFVGDFIDRGKSFFEKTDYTIKGEENAKLLKFNKKDLLKLAKSSSEIGLLMLKDTVRYGNV